MKYFLFIVLSILSLNVYAQKVEGIVKAETGEPLPFSSITLKGRPEGFTANNQGRFEFSLPVGSYILICQHVGYERQEKIVNVTSQTEQVNFTLKRHQLKLKDVIIKSDAEDPAYEIIRQAIKKRDFYYRQVNAFTCEAYIKGLIQLRHLPKRVLGKKIPTEDRSEMGLDSAGKGIIFLSESVTRVAIQRPDKIKLEVVSGRQSGGSGFGLNFPTFISFYENNISLSEQLNPRGFVSPIADGAISFYRFKFLGSFFEDGKEINSIRVIPRRNYEPLFSGTINITEGDWRIHSCDLRLTKTSQLELLDTLEIRQIHVPVSKDIWRVRSQAIYFNIKQFGIDAIGNFVNVYSRYDLNPQFPKNYFDRVIVKFDTAVNKKSKEYWDTIRPVPLEPEEARDYKIKDSIYLARKDSVLSSKDIDSLKKRQGRVSLSDIFISGGNRTHYSKANTFRWHIEPVIRSVQYTAVEGAVVQVEADYYKTLKKWKTNLTVAPNFRYGFKNERFYAWADVNFRSVEWNIDSRPGRSSWNFAGGKRVAQFNKESEITPMGNTISTLFYGNNHFKIYETYFGEIHYSKNFENGFTMGLTALYEDRRPLENVTDYVLVKKHRGKITPNYPVEIMRSNFNAHHAMIVSAGVSFQPGQRYIQFPRGKMAIGSKYPTFTFEFVKGIINLAGSDVDFDKWKFIIRDDINLKLAGILKYKVAAGGFFNKDRLFVQDYNHFQGNTSVLAKSYVNTFQMAGYYELSNTANVFAELHGEHHLNGLLTNKIPLFKRLNWNLVDGYNGLYYGGGRYYYELFVGLENILKILRIDVVFAFKDHHKMETGLRIGVGGIIGSSVSSSGRFKGRSRL